MKVKKPKIRNPYANLSKKRKAGKIKDKREERSGTKNIQKEYKKQYEDEK